MPSGTYPISAYPNALETRDLLEDAVESISVEAKEAVRPLLESLDAIFYAHTVPDEEGELRPWVRPPSEGNARGWWRRKPRVSPW